MRSLLRRWWFGDEDRIALDVQGDRLVVASSMGWDRSACRVEELSGEFLGGALRHGVVTDLGVMSEALRRLLRDVALPYTRMGVALSSQTTFTTRIVFPSEDIVNERDTLEQRTFERLSLEPHQHIVKVFPDLTGDEEAHCLVVVTKREVMESWIEISRLLGVDLSIVVPRALILPHIAGDEGDPARSDANLPESTLWVELLEGRASLYLFRGGALLQSVVINASPDEDPAVSLIGVERHLDRLGVTPASASRVRVIGEIADTARLGLCDMLSKRIPAAEVSFVTDLSVPARVLVNMVGA